MFKIDAIQTCTINVSLDDDVLMVTDIPQWAGVVRIDVFVNEAHPNSKFSPAVGWDQEIGHS